MSYLQKLQESSYRRPGTSYYVAPTSEQFHINDHSKNYGVYESKPKPDPVVKKADAGAFTAAPNPMDPKVSGVFESKTEEGSTQKEKWGTQLQRTEWVQEKIDPIGRVNGVFENQPEPSRAPTEVIPIQPGTIQSKQAAIANNFDLFNKKGTREEIRPTVAPSKIKSKFINEDEQKTKESLKHLTLESSESDSDWRSTNSGYADLPTMIAENDLGTMKKGKRLDFNSDANTTKYFEKESKQGTSDSESDSEISSVSGASWNSSRSHSVNSNIGSMKPTKKMQAIPDTVPGYTDNSSWNDSHKSTTDVDSDDTLVDEHIRSPKETSAGSMRWYDRTGSPNDTIKVNPNMNETSLLTSVMREVDPKPPLSTSPIKNTYFTKQALQPSQQNGALSEWTDDQSTEVQSETDSELENSKSTEIEAILRERDNIPEPEVQRSIPKTREIPVEKADPEMAKEINKFYNRQPPKQIVEPIHKMSAMNDMKEHRKPKKEKKPKIRSIEMAVDVDEPSLEIETKTKKMKPVGSIDTGIENQSFTNSEAVSKSSESTTKPDKKKKRGELNRQLREKTGLGNDDLTYVTVSNAPKKTPVNLQNGHGPGVHSDPDSDEEMLKNLPSTKEEIVNPSRMRHMEKKKKWYQCCGSCGRKKKQDKVGVKPKKKGLFG